MPWIFVVMASATRLPIKSIVFTISLAGTVAASRVNIRNLLTSTFTGPGSKSRIVAFLLILANLKNVPFAWHFRVFNGILKHCLFSIPHIPPKLASTALFCPTITSSHSPLWECDYNFHKSNSTYFSDLDVTRTHLISCLLQPGIDSLHHNPRDKLVLKADGSPVTERWNIMLGSVMCSFKREIGIYHGFEMWSRLLCWDRKWIYMVTHFVKKGTVRPSAYLLTDGSWFGARGYTQVGDGKGKSADIDEKAIHATAISKYVIKLGRLTIHPEVALGASGLLPERPGGWAKMDGSQRPSGEITPETEAEDIEVSSDAAGEDWDWKRVVAENEKGLRWAKHFAALDDLHHEFSGSQKPALGRYRDFLF